MSPFQGPGRSPSDSTEEDRRSDSTTTAPSNPRISAAQFEDPERLDPKYQLQNGRTFFVRGRVFAMMFPEPRAEKRNQLDTGPDDSRFGIMRHGEEVIFAHIKRFAVIRERAGHCLCVPINSYRKTGVGRKGTQRDKKRAHAIIYDSRKAPPRPILPGEQDLIKNPIAVDMNGSNTLEDTSRIDFGNIYTIEWNVKVYGIGHIAEQSTSDVEKYWQEELIR
jgi:hypothetical protein